MSKIETIVKYEKGNGGESLTPCPFNEMIRVGSHFCTRNCSFCKAHDESLKTVLCTCTGGVDSPTSVRESARERLASKNPAMAEALKGLNRDFDPTEGAVQAMESVMDMLGSVIGNDPTFSKQLNDMAKELAKRSSPQLIETTMSCINEASRLFGKEGQTFKNESIKHLISGLEKFIVE